MGYYRAIARSARLLCQSGLSMLLLLGLAACGVAGPRAEVPAAATAPEPTATTANDGVAVATVSAPSTPQGATDQLPPTEVPTAVPRSLPPTPKVIPTSAPAASQDWKTYRNAQAGYSVAYPPDWKAVEVPGARGEFITKFTPAAGAASIVIAVRPIDPDQKEPIDLPNTRCQLVTVGGLSGVRCFDTISLSGSTTVAGKDKQFIITTTGKRPNEKLYQQFLDSFQVIP
ncbi:MAG TPA: hypothetical protein VGJ87_14280 [Roseiflexaceae bacterium]